MGRSADVYHSSYMRGSAFCAAFDWHVCTVISHSCSSSLKLGLFADSPSTFTTTLELSLRFQIDGKQVQLLRPDI
jgi:hypothetical protein